MGLIQVQDLLFRGLGGGPLAARGGLELGILRPGMRVRIMEVA